MFLLQVFKVGREKVVMILYGFFGNEKEEVLLYWKKFLRKGIL